MIRQSLRFRLLALGIGAVLLALATAGGGLVLLFQRHVERSLAADLDVYVNQLLAGINVDADGRLALAAPPADPRFAEPLSGLYWQASDERGDVLRSRSLWDTTLALPGDELSPGDIHHHTSIGPGESRVLVAERRVYLTAGDRRIAVRLATAADLARVTAAASAFARDLAVALALLAVVLGLATSLQVALGLRPLAFVRRGVAEIRAGRTGRLALAVPIEVKPLVEEVNALLELQEGEIERSRRRAADLAHGLKTPLAALAADASRLREHGEDAIANDIESVASAMGRHVDRELARARLRGSARALGASTRLAPLVGSLLSTLARTPDGSRIVFEQHVPNELALPIDRTDLAEVLGNLIENAARHASARVRITGLPAPDGPSVTIEDDGPGIPPDARATVLAAGGRLDQRGSAGLGLAIVQDVLGAYGWALGLGTSDLGGLKATVAPVAQRFPSFFRNTSAKVEQPQHPSRVSPAKAL